MFPVTLEDVHGGVMTVWPPCYGFLQKANYNGGDYNSDDDDDDYDYYESNTYPISFAWNMITRLYREESSPARADAFQEVVLEREMAMDDIKHIWNSGTHLPIQGVLNSAPETVVSEEFSFADCDIGDPRPKSQVEIWADKNNRPDVTMKLVMETLEEFVDSGRRSCLVWHDEGFMGVETENIPADRCLFYLMVNRSFYEEGDEGPSQTFLDLWFKKGWTPLQALAFSRIISTSENVFGEKRVAFVGNDWDSCILPISLYDVGIGNRMAEPSATPWRQESYRQDVGHLRDDDYSCISFDRYNTNNSMFLPILHPSLIAPDSLKVEGEGLLLKFAEEICLDEETRKLLVIGRYGSDDPTRVNTYNIITNMMHSGVSNNESFNVIKDDKWEEILENLFFGK